MAMPKVYYILTIIRESQMSYKQYRTFKHIIWSKGNTCAFETTHSRFSPPIAAIITYVLLGRLSIRF